jgi:hypothetical protein
MKRFTLGFCVLVCATIGGVGVYFVYQQQRTLACFVPTRATILSKRVEKDEYWNRLNERTFKTRPVVEYSFEVEGRQITSEEIFPSDATQRSSGSDARLARDWANSVVARFQVGEETTAYFNPQNPAEACLILRPQCVLYLAILLPAAVASGILGLWPSSRSKSPERKQRKGRLVAALWYLIGLVSAGHYFYLAGADYSGGAMAMFGGYTLLGLIPVGVALPSTGFGGRLKGAVGTAVFGTFAGLFLGLLVGGVIQIFSGSVIRGLSWGCYIVVATAALFGFFGFTGRLKIGEDEEDASPHQTES